jgi:hypothetical protein
MDPYVEEPSLWPDFHAALLVAVRAALNAVLPPRYAAFIDRYVWLEEEDSEERVRDGNPDVFVAELGGETTAAAVAVLAAPATVLLPSVRREGPRYLRIVDRESRRVVTVIELLSPSNKEPGPDRDAYLAKRNEYLATGTNLIEIDLLRSGQRPPTREPASIPSDYLILVSPASDFPRAGVWAFGVREPLPLVPVPLARGEAPVMLDLKRCLDRTYDEAPYQRVLDYTHPPTPPLTDTDATWAREMLSRATHPGGPT